MITLFFFSPVRFLSFFSLPPTGFIDSGKVIRLLEEAFHSQERLSDDVSIKFFVPQSIYEGTDKEIL